MSTRLLCRLLFVLRVKTPGSSLADAEAKKIAPRWHMPLILHCVCPSYVKDCQQDVKLYFRVFFYLAVQLAGSADAHWRVAAAELSLFFSFIVLKLKQSRDVRVNNMCSLSCFQLFILPHLFKNGLSEMHLNVEIS